MKIYAIWKKTLAFVFIGVLIALIFTFTDTYSLFQTIHDGDGSVIAASREDIISSMEIYYKGHEPILRLEKGNKIAYSPIVFFSIEGDAKDYALHVNSIELDGTVETPIIPNVNFPQILSLILSPRDEVTGILRVKHLNEFIDDTLEFSFSKDYLLSRYFYDRGLKVSNENYLSRSEKAGLINLVEDTLLYVKRYLEWDMVKWEEENNWISELDINDEQVSLVDIVAPGLIEYNEKLYQFFEVIVKDFENEIEKNSALSRENQELMSIIEDLKEENKKTSQLLEEIKDDLDDEIQKNNKLYRENRDLIGANERLWEENEELYNSIYILELEIEELLDRLNKNELESDKAEETTEP